MARYVPQGRSSSFTRFANGASRATGKPGTFVLPVFKADGGLTGPGLTINPLFDSGTASTTPIFKPTTYTDATTQYIEYTIDYRPDGLTPNASNVGSTVNDIQNEGVETYQVIADGQLLTCEPATVLPMAQRYFLF